MTPRLTDGKLTSVEDVLDQMPGLEVFRARLELLRLQDAWREAVGPTLAAASAPGSLERGKLTIIVSSSTWNMTLRSMEKRLLAKLHQLAPELEIRALRVEVGTPEALRRATPPPAERQDYPEPAELDSVSLSASARRGILDTAAHIEDEDLRRRFVDTMTRAQQLRHWRLQHGWTIDRRTGDLLPPVRRPAPPANRPAPSRTVVPPPRAPRGPSR